MRTKIISLPGTDDPSKHPIYVINEIGEVRAISDKNGWLIDEPTPIAIVIDRNGHPKTMYSINDKRVCKKVSTIMGEVFLKKTSEDVLMHINGDKTNNRLDNLKIASKRFKLTEDVVMKIYSQKDKKTCREIAAEFGVSKATVNDIHVGNTWSEITGQTRSAKSLLIKKSIKQKNERLKELKEEVRNRNKKD